MSCLNSTSLLFIICLILSIFIMTTPTNAQVRLSSSSTPTNSAHLNSLSTTTTRSSVAAIPAQTHQVLKPTASSSSRQSSTPTATPNYNFQDFNNLPGNPDPNQIKIISATTIKHTGIKSPKPTGIVNSDQSETGAGNSLRVGGGFGSMWSILILELGTLMISLAFVGFDNYK
ncbi:4444_t:CDS:1 [Acaulospora morrowiae]|uniref:4444_t:CDS:1 n=1 Tax=Acaulospora morrowiae TaxID=94023 RepID=A0A9N8VDM6_9GLOM|nr:4444_t:CDS:1 [Acaulospora morrowiae]